MSIESYVSLIVASLDLQLVQDLRAAMNGGVDPGGPHVGPPAGYLLAPDPPPTPQAGEQSPAVRVEVRDVYVPARCECGPQRSAVYNRWTQSSAGRGWAADAFAATPCAPRPNICQSPVQPPWKVLPWQEPTPVTPRPIIKLFVQSTDKTLKGSVLDCFI